MWPLMRLEADGHDDADADINRDAKVIAVELFLRNKRRRKRGNRQQQPSFGAGVHGCDFGNVPRTQCAKSWRHGKVNLLAGVDQLLNGKVLSPNFKNPKTTACSLDVNQLNTAELFILQAELLHFIGDPSAIK